MSSLTTTGMGHEPAGRDMAALDVARLARAAAGGDRAAFGLLYDRFGPLVRAMGYDLTRNHHAAQDMAQEVFTRAWSGLGGLRKPEGFSAWLIGIARRVGLEWLARKKEVGLDAGFDVVTPQAARKDEEDELLGAVAGLPEDERLAIHLFYLEEEPAELAREVMGLSRSGFYKVLERAREQLREELERE